MKKFIVLFLILFIGNCSFAKDIKVEYNNGIYHIVLGGRNLPKKLKFISSDKLISNKEIHKITKSKLTINTGFFDPKNQKTISYIVSDGMTAEDPATNENLMTNPVLRANMSKILNRSEFRVIECDNKYHYEIVPHNTDIDYTCSIVTSAQGGPQLLPELRLEEEFFILRDENGRIIRESASVLEKTARTIIGLKDGVIHIIIITNENPKTIFEAKKVCEYYKLDSAMAFDGGSSTSLNYKDIEVVSTSSPAGRRLKSFMVINKPKKVLSFD